VSPVAGLGPRETEQTAGKPHATAARPDVPRRIAAIIDAANLSGPGRQLVALCGALRERGVQLHVVTFRRGTRPTSALVAHLESVGADVTVLPENGPMDVMLVRRLREVLESLDPQIVQTHGYRPTALMYLLRRSGGAWPWIVYYHGATTENWKVRLYHWLDQRLMPAADRIVVMSSRHERNAPARARDRVRVLHNAAIPERLDPVVEARAEESLRGLPLDSPVLGVVGRLSSEKGVDIFLDAARLLVDRGVAFSAIIVGDGPDRDALERTSIRLGLDGCVRFLGPFGAVSPVYRRLDALVIPSRSEGLPNVLLEALAADVPCVATDVGAIPEVLPIRTPASSCRRNRPTSSRMASSPRSPSDIAPRA
jgi:glycosyltransferase involved in cell wall biosynthesis